MCALLVADGCLVIVVNSVVFLLRDLMFLGCVCGVCVMLLLVIVVFVCLLFCCQTCCFVSVIVYLVRYVLCGCVV